MAQMPRVGAFQDDPVSRLKLGLVRPDQALARPMETAATQMTVLESLPAPKPIEIDVVAPAPPSVAKTSFLQKCKAMWDKRRKIIIAVIVIVVIAIVIIAIAIKVAIDKAAARRKKAKRKKVSVDDEDEEEEEKPIRGTKIPVVDESMTTLQKIEQGVGSIKRIINGTPI